MEPLRGSFAEWQRFHKAYCALPTADRRQKASQYFKMELDQDFAHEASRFHTFPSRIVVYEDGRIIPRGSFRVLPGDLRLLERLAAGERPQSSKSQVAPYTGRVARVWLLPSLVAALAKRDPGLGSLGGSGTRRVPELWA